MMAKPMKTLELHYLTIHRLIFDISCTWKQHRAFHLWPRLNMTSTLSPRTPLSNHNHFVRIHSRNNSWCSEPTLARGHVISSASDSWPLTGMCGTASLLVSSLRRASSASADLKACWDRAFSWAHFSRSAFSTDSTCSFVWREFWNKLCCHQFFKDIF